MIFENVLDFSSHVSDLTFRISFRISDKLSGDASPKLRQFVSKTSLERHGNMSKLHHQNLYCDLACSVGSREHSLCDTARKRNAFLLISIVLRIFQFP